MSTFTELFIWLYALPLIFLTALFYWFSDDFKKHEISLFKILKFIPFLNLTLGAFMMIAWLKFCIEYIYDKLKKKGV